MISLDFAVGCGEVFSLPPMHGVIRQHPSGRGAWQPLGMGAGQPGGSPGWEVPFGAVPVVPFCF